MRTLHILAGLAGLVSGTVALYALKGGRLHRKSGMVFVYTMLFMASSGALIAAMKPEVVAVNVIAGVLTCYFVLTAVLAVRRPVPRFDWINGPALLAALGVAIAAFVLAASRASRGRPGEPGVMYFVFGVIALLAVAGDVRMMLTRRLQGRRRIVRHLWRMCFALFVAAGSFFLGQPQVFPKAVRSSGVLALPVLLVLFTMFFWLARVSFSRRFRSA
jgi:hypothetical protein